VGEGTGGATSDAISAELVAAYGKLFDLGLSNEESVALVEHLAALYADVAALWPAVDDGTAPLRGDG
jgi:hypothetical protein